MSGKMWKFKISEMWKLRSQVCKHAYNTSWITSLKFQGDTTEMSACREVVWYWLQRFKSWAKIITITVKASQVANCAREQANNGDT